MTIYTDLRAAKVAVGCSGPDLYAQVNDKSCEIIERYRFKESVQQQPAKIKGRKTDDYFFIPNAFDPYWQKSNSPAIGLS